MDLGFGILEFELWVWEFGFGILEKYEKLKMAFRGRNGKLKLKTEMKNENANK